MSNPPRRADIRGQDHILSYITPEEADILKFLGGSGRPGPMGIPAYDDIDESYGIDSFDDYGGGGMNEGQDSVTSDTYSPSGGATGGGGGGGQDRGGMEDTLNRYRDELAAQQQEQQRQEQNRQSEDAARARKQALDFARDQATPPSPYDDYLNINPQYPNAQNFGRRVGRTPDFSSQEFLKGGKPYTGPVTEPLFDFLNARSQSVPLTAADLDQQRRSGSYDPSKDTFDEEGDFLTDNKGFTQSEFERIAGITDTNPRGDNPAAGSSTAFGRGITAAQRALGLKVGDKRAGMTKGQQDFYRQQAYERYKDPYGQGKMFVTMKNYNLSPAEKAEYERQQILQETDKPQQVVTYADYADKLGEDSSRYRQPNTIRPGLSEGDITDLGRVVGRPREMSDSELVARGLFAMTPMGIPLAGLEAAFGLNRELGIEGQPGPDGQPFVSAPGQGGLGQLFNVATGGAGTRAIDRASELATGLVNKQPDIPGLTSGANAQVDVGIYDRPNFLERLFGGESSYNERYGQNQNQYPEGGGRDGAGESDQEDIIRDPEEPVDEITSPDDLFGQEKYQGPKGGFIFDPVQNLPEVYAGYAGGYPLPRLNSPFSPPSNSNSGFPPLMMGPIRPYYGIGGIPTRNV